MDDGDRTPEQGYTISSPCEPDGSSELIISGRGLPKLNERTKGRKNLARNDPDRNGPLTYERLLC